MCQFAQVKLPTIIQTAFLDRWTALRSSVQSLWTRYDVIVSQV